MATQVAFERFLASMSAHVQTERVFPIEAFPANLAIIGLLPSMHYLVLHQGLPSKESFLAVTAFIRFVVLVSFHVHAQSAIIFTAYRTCLFSIRFLNSRSVSMKIPHVSFQRIFLDVAFTTKIAQLRAFALHWNPVVVKLMHGQFVFGGKCFTANYAYEFDATDYVTLFMLHQIDGTVEALFAMPADVFEPLKVNSVDV